jgi:hypothetical protein
MIYQGITIPTSALAISSIILSFVAGIGIGAGTETGKWAIHKWIIWRAEKLYNKIIDIVTLKEKWFKKTKPNILILAREKNDRHEIQFQPRSKNKKRILQRIQSKSNRMYIFRDRR